MEWQRFAFPKDLIWHKSPQTHLCQSQSRALSVGKISTLLILWLCCGQSRYIYKYGKCFFPTPSDSYEKHSRDSEHQSWPHSGKSWSMHYLWGYESFHPTGCPNNGIIWKGCGNVGHGLLLCRKVMSLTKVGKPSSNFKGNLSRKDKDKKKRKAEESASDKDKQKTVKQSK